MSEALDKTNTAVLECMAERLKNANDTLNGIISHFKGEILADQIENKRTQFEVALEYGDDAISDFENFVIEHSSQTKFDRKIIKEFEYQKKIYRIREELLAEILTEAYKKSFQIVSKIKGESA